MAQQPTTLSPDTLAILAELKKQGDMTRKDGRTYSIKTASIKLDKIGGLLDSISTTITSQTDLLRNAAGLNQQAVAAQQQQNTLLQMAGITAQDQAELEKRRFQTEQLKIDQDYKDEEEREKKRSDNEKGFFSKLGGIFNKKAFSNLLTGIKWAAVGAILAPLGYQFVAGILEGMGVDVKSFEQGFAEGFNKFVKFLKETDWSAITSTLNAIASPEGLAGLVTIYSLPKILETIRDTVLLGGALKAIGNLGGGNIPPVPTNTGGRPGPGPTPPGPGPTPPGRGPNRGRNPFGNFELTDLKKFLTVRNAVLSVVGAGLIGYADEIGELLGDDAKSITKNELMNADVRDTTGNENLSIIAGAASIGSLFGIKGIIVGAALGGTYVIGKTLYDAVNDEINDLGELPNEIEAAMKAERNKGKRRRGAAAREVAKTVEEAAAKEIPILEEKLIAAKAELEELLNKPIESKTRGGMRAAKASRERAANELREQISLFETQIDNAVQLLLERKEAGIADLDISAPGIQTTAPPEVSLTGDPVMDSILKHYEARTRESAAENFEKDLRTLNQKLDTVESNSEKSSAPIYMDNSTQTSVGPTYNTNQRSSSHASAVTVGGVGGLYNGNAFGSISGLA